MPVGILFKIFMPRTNPALYKAGSEPSLGSNGLKPAGSNCVSASKRTLVSQENISPSPPTATGRLSHTTTAPRKSSTDGSLDGNQSAPEGSPKTPSYLKLSCAVSGYSPYNSYNNSPRLNSRTNEDKVESNSSLDQENIVPNGDIDHGSKVHKIKVAPVKDKSTVVNNAAASTQLTNGAILSNSAVVCKLDVGDMPTCTGSPVTVSHGIVTDSGLDSPDSSRPLPKSQPHRPDQVISTPPHSNKPVNDKVLTPQKDGRYFYTLIDQESDRLTALCQRAEQDLNTGLVPEDVSGKLRAAIGKANLLVTKKFKQFRGLCDKNLEQDNDEPFQTTCQDLAGFWDMVLLQVEDITDMFDDIDRLRRSGWKGLTLSNSKLYAVNPVKSKPGGVRVKSAKSKPATTTIASAPKSAKSSEAAKQRDEARRRLIAAKRAGRQRKESQNDTEVEIFVPQ